MVDYRSANQISNYFEAIRTLLDHVAQSQGKVMNEVAELLADTVVSNHTIYITGCSHSSIFAQEVYFRAGGFMLMNPLFLPGMVLGVPPVTLTSRYERIPGIAQAVLEESPIQKGDVLIVASVSGRNIVPVELALCARELGVKVVALTSETYSGLVSSRHESGKRLYEIANYILDMMSPHGDAMLGIDGLKQRTAPSSTIVGVTILHAVIAQTLQRLVDKGVAPPVFLSANLDGADDYNREMLKKYRDRIHYM